MPRLAAERAKRTVATGVAVLLAITACRGLAPSGVAAIVPANPSYAQNVVFSLSIQNSKGVCVWTIADHTILEFAGTLVQGVNIPMKSLSKAGQTTVTATCQNGTPNTIVTVRPPGLDAQSGATHGSAHGSLVLQGGIGSIPAISSAFVALAGGAAAHIIVIPTASVGDAGPPGMAEHLARRMNENFGVAEVVVVHTIDRAEADTDRFVEPLRRASGVWMLGGFPENLVHAYLGTKVERAINDLLDRGGVVGGESAGAMIQGSWLDTADNEGFTPEILAVIRKHPSGGGFGLLANAAIFPHFDARGPAAAIKESAAAPGQPAIGIDNDTALVVSGAAASVVGSGTVSMYNGTGRGAPNVIVLRSGDRYDLSTRRKQWWTPSSGANVLYTPAHGCKARACGGCPAGRRATSRS